MPMMQMPMMIIGEGTSESGLLLLLGLTAIAQGAIVVSRPSALQSRPVMFFIASFSFFLLCSLGLAWSYVVPIAMHCSLVSRFTLLEELHSREIAKEQEL